MHAFDRWGGAAAGLLAAGGAALAATAFAFLYISERTPLFGIMEPGYDPAGIRSAQVSEVASVLLLGGFVVARYVGRTPARRW